MKLVVKNISKQFGKTKVLNNINFELATGEIVSLIGRNGSGKTTLLNLISGIYSLENGSIEINQKDIEKNNLKELLIYIPDKLDYFRNSKIKNFIKYYKLAYSKFDLTYLMGELKRNDIEINKKISELSKGQSIIFGVILGLACRTKFLLLDEPLDGIDVINIKLIINYIIEAQENGIGVLVSSHQLNYIENISNKIIYLDKEGENTRKVDKNKYSKYQIVYEKEIPKWLISNSKIKVLSNIGRVYVIIADESFKEMDGLIEESGALQYDRLPVMLEDIFLINDKGDKNYE
ncbi:ATP-binding cassette domain-containing protein [Gemella cuniculi]|uniref:ATP-binding cassette domain-containing protein n=1 Tax=Gemella cuniculi TaxID=150240 RepID=UPI00041D05A1|nr:ATP-binding cassette domain-containing protein [Gemella cuniculi]